MKLLFDEMLAPSLVHRLSDLFQDSDHVRNLGLKQTPDADVWHRAKELGYTLVAKDKDFANLSTVWAAPPKVILLQLGNCLAGWVSPIATSCAANGGARVPMRSRLALSEFRSRGQPTRQD